MAILYCDEDENGNYHDCVRTDCIDIPYDLIIISLIFWIIFVGLIIWFLCSILKR